MKRQIVLIEWLDAEGESGWTSIDECAKHEVVPVISVGWLICENNKVVVVASVLREHGDECSSIDFIPIGCVIRRRTLWHPDSDGGWREMWTKPFHLPEAL